MSDPMPEVAQNTAEAGEPENTPDIDVKSIQDQYFRKGHGKGRAEGRNEGHASGRAEVMEALGLGEDADLADAAARLQGPPPEDSAREIGLLNRKISEYEKHLEISKARSDRYMFSEMKAAALGAGVRPTMVDDFSLIYSRNLKWDGADLAVYDGDTPTGEDLSQYVARVLKDKPDWQAPRGMEGAGDLEAKKVAPRRRTSMRNDHLTASERLRGGK